MMAMKDVMGSYLRTGRKTPGDDSGLNTCEDAQVKAGQRRAGYGRSG
jgi:hypothetical protein